MPHFVRNVSLYIKLLGWNKNVCQKIMWDYTMMLYPLEQLYRALGNKSSNSPFSCLLTSTYNDDIVYLRPKVFNKRKRGYKFQIFTPVSCSVIFEVPQRPFILKRVLNRKFWVSDVNFIIALRCWCAVAISYWQKFLRV